MIDSAPLCGATARRIGVHFRTDTGKQIMELVPNTGRDYRPRDKDRADVNAFRSLHLVRRIVSKQFRDTRTGEIVTQVPLSQIRYFEEV